MGSASNQTRVKNPASGDNLVFDEVSSGDWKRTTADDLRRWAGNFAVASMQDLLNEDLERYGDGDSVYVRNFYPDVQGGGDPFDWDANGEKGDHDGIMTIDPTHSTTPGNAGWWTNENSGTTGVFRRREKGYILSRDAGAKLDGTTNDTNAFDALITLDISPIIIEEGTPLLDKWVISSSNGIVIRGAGKERTVIKSNVTGDYSVHIQDDVDEIRICDLSIDGNDTANEVFSESNYSLYENVKVVNHVGKNFFCQGLVGKIDHCEFRPSFGASLTSECAAYFNWNAIEITGQSYFNTQQESPAIKIDDHPTFGDSLNIVFENSTIENATKAFELVSNIDTASLTIANSYFELVEPTTAEILRVTGGEHQSINIYGNHTNDVKNTFVFDQVDKESHIEIWGNDLYRPIKVLTQASAATKFRGRSLPHLDIKEQYILFGDNSITFELTPVVIVDDYMGFTRLLVEKLDNIGIDYSYNKVEGRTYFETSSNTAETPFNILIEDNGGTSYAKVIQSDFNINWRQGPQSETGNISFQADNHEIKSIARNTGTLNEEHTTSSINTDGTVVTAVDILEDAANNQIQLELTGESGTTPNQWFVEFTLNYMT